MPSPTALESGFGELLAIDWELLCLQSLLDCIVMLMNPHTS
jgi:hypothetical protein